MGYFQSLCNKLPEGRYPLTTGTALPSTPQRKKAVDLRLRSPTLDFQVWQIHVAIERLRSPGPGLSDEQTGMRSKAVCYDLVGGFNLPLWKMMEFVSWDDDIPNTSIWKNPLKSIITSSKPLWSINPKWMQRNLFHSCSKPPTRWSILQYMQELDKLN